MTQSKHDYYVSQLSTTDKAERIKALRFIKNSIIGNKTKKDLYINLDILPRLIEIIVNNDHTTDPQSKIQAVVILGSLAYGYEENVCTLIEAGVIPPLLNCLSLRNELKLVEAAARALKALFNSPRAPKQHIFETGHIIEFVSLLKGFSQASKDAPFSCQYATHVPEYKKRLWTHFKHFVSKTRRLEKPWLQREGGSLINLSRSNVIPDHQSDITLIVLPTVVKLLSEPDVSREKASFILAYLVSESEDLQKAACEADAIGKLTSLICQPDEEFSNLETQAHYDRIKESALLAIAAISSLKEECRVQVIEAKALPHIVAAMSHRNNLRTSLVDAGIAIPLFQLLSDESTSVQTTASATLCNIVLGFSPMKITVLENGAEPEIKQTVMKHLTYQKLQTYVSITDIFNGDATQRFGNQHTRASAKSVEETWHAIMKRQNIEEVFQGIGEHNLIFLFESKLNSKHEDIILQTLYTIVNVATGNERHKMALINSDTILKAISDYMTHSKASIRVATVWCIINLTWTEERHSYAERVRKLQTLGFETKLNSLVDDPDLDVRDRVKTALTHFRTSELFP
ncbi:ARM repeat-containing protein [Basidiobolus meristosporus CBS 931.73]|uniref:ARM repeat-containing protein n=1 Tax=Basidiobolus meristosporus CBS 931.73 TaxID=1314790 RepID=A0A1Y1ZE88_9FUNG|nr:ARM repeat-containing protein [Basidiobolus meristosporus CBS 931.73]|eukprot:ORY08135.1 ARM repeat-containing protein [Basidiobolus meristosporus CBS 931.73]